LRPSWAGGGTGSVGVLGLQTSTDVTKHPDALKASGTRLKVLECGGFQCRPVVLGDGLKQNVWGGSGKPKFVANRACLVSAANHENSVKDRYFVKMATNTCILDDFRYKNHQKQPVGHLNMVFFNEKAPR
jgi:hypothetical protein